MGRVAMGKGGKSGGFFGRKTLFDGLQEGMDLFRRAFA